MTALIEYRHPTAGFGFPLPAEWERVEDSQPGVPLIAVEPDHGLGFRANVVVTVEQLPEGYDLETWQAASEQLLPQQLHEYLLIDSERVEIAGYSALRRLAHHAQAESGAVTMEQWAVTAGEYGLTLTTSVGTLAYTDHTDTFAGMADAFRIGGAVGPG